MRERERQKIQLLREVISKRQPDLLPLVDKVGVVALTDEELERLGNVVFAEFVETGLKEDDEPNPRGLLLDDLMGFLVPYRCNP